MSNVEMDYPDVFAHVTFCDDIREEINHKLMFVGVYRGSLLITGDFPFELQSLALHVVYCERKGVWNGPVHLNLYLPGEEEAVFSQPLLMEQARADLRPPLADPDFPEPQFIKYETSGFLNKLLLKRRGLLQVRISVGEKLVKAGSLRVDRLGNPPSL